MSAGLVLICEVPQALEMPKLLPPLSVVTMTEGHPQASAHAVVNLSNVDAPTDDMSPEPRGQSPLTRATLVTLANNNNNTAIAVFVINLEEKVLN